MNEYESYINRCFELAKKGLGSTSPNPIVGCVIVKDGNVLAEGFHKKAGTPHAEADALNKINDQGQGATLYCNLEPCCHTAKKTPPCAQRIIKAGIKKVVISNLDPNPEVAGRGVKILQDAGIEVITGIFQEEGEILNEVFFHHIIHKRPFIHLKWAQTLDGKMATLTGDSKWITNSSARIHVHQERKLYDAILIGAQTLLNDNPKLTIRLNDTEIAKKRLVLSNGKSFSEDLNLFNDTFKEKTKVYVKQESLAKTLQSMYQDGICSIYVEGGAHTLKLFLEENLYERLSIYVAPKLLGEGLFPYHKNVDLMSECLHIENCHIKQFGNNVLFESKRNLCLQD